MKHQLVTYLGNGLRIEALNSWSNQSEVWFKELEAYSFRKELRYDSGELRERLEKEDVLFLFIVVNERPEGVILGYPIQQEEGTAFYLDTFAIRTRGRGIGRIVLKHVIEWASESGFKAIQLDTEAMNEVGQSLQKFYESFGFVVQRIEEDGNITMRLAL
ncbi:MAG: GNAT family N-acetyltransferase [Promethearchaeota archaeon]